MSTSESTSDQAVANALAQYKKRRGIVKGACTRIDKYVAAVEIVDDLTKEQLAERRLRLTTCWDEYNSLQLRIEDLDANEAKDREAFEEYFYTLCAKIAQKIKSANAGASARSSPHPEGVEYSDGAGGSGDAMSGSRICLPRLNLPTFSGKYDQWFPFFDAFKGTVHNNHSLPKFEKFQYLKAALTDEALAVIDTLEISETNYDLAWQLLQERYDNKRLIVYTHIKGLMELPQLHKENALKIRRMCDSVTRHMRALTSLKCRAESWDDLVVYILSAKLDHVTQREWQNSLTGSMLPTLKQFTDFLAHRGRVLESVSAREVAASRRIETRAISRNESRRQALHATAIGSACSYCRGDHAIYACSAFAELPVNQRIAEMRKRKLCLNCLRSASHRAAQCPSGNCKICKGRHSSLLHLMRDSDAGVRGVEADRAPSGGSAVTLSESTALMARRKTEKDASDVFLSTAMVYVLDKGNARKPIRALLDSGSQANFVTARAAKLLSLTLRPVNIAISGVGKITTNSTHATRLTVRSRAKSFVANIECIVTDKITGKIPAVTVRHGTITLPANIQLADLQYFKAAEIDMLIGAELFYQLLCVGQIRATQSHPTLQKTRLGWILSGRVGDASNTVVRTRVFHATVTNSKLHESLSRFWELDEITNRSVETLTEQACEAHFMGSVATDAAGKYVVKLPVRPEIMRSRGQSRDIAVKRLYCLERRFARDASLRAAYTDFMREYLTLGHMRLVADSEFENSRAVYLPHHGVIKGSGQNAKLRVVFDASAKDDRGVSLNEMLMTGPTIQQDLLSILLRFQMWRYVFSADVIKMYRQIRVHDSQTHLQRIVWCDSPAEPIRAYELLTVTYGTTSAPFLATRCLQHLAQQSAKNYPIGSRHIMSDFYVDDLFTGADTLTDAMRARDEIVTILRGGQFELSKWLVNHCDLLPHDTGVGSRTVSLSGDAEHRILGVRWDPSSDEIVIETSNDKRVVRITKRTVLAEIAGLFDPLGVVGPVIVVAKIVLQEMWMMRVDWEESLPQDLHERWVEFRRQLQRLRDVRIPRWTGFRDGREMQVHGFCDASERAYGACVYIRTAANEGRYNVALLASKSRVAPIRAVSLPRLELSAAVLLTNLIERVCSSIGIRRKDVILWSDSTITLQWIASPSRKWNTFVANRVGEIQRVTDVDSWRHVPTAENPADILSRGMNVEELIESSLWWKGPAFLQSPVDRWPPKRTIAPSADAPEQRRITVATAVIELTPIQRLLTRHSSLNRVLRIVAYCRRFGCAGQQTYSSVFIEPSELGDALRVIVRSVQREAFASEYEHLRVGRALHNQSCILSLTPFLDGDGMIRVGGRLKNAAIPYDARHPILLPKGHRLTILIIEGEHKNTLHSSVQTTLAAVRQRFWPISATSVVRGFVRNCITCFKCKPKMSQARMADLPQKRVTISRPFTHVGIDYAGPVMLKEGRRRNARLSKAYIAVFVCFTVKAIHLEIVTDMTSDAFLGAFKRFMSRRGRPECIYSDNGTTFVGANKQIKEMYEFVKSDQTQIDVRKFLCDREIRWNFIPPHAPHFGGLWEAGVKSAKTHLNRVIGNANLTYEEMQTTLCEIEAVLNSRPLAPLSADPNDNSCITPGHFLIGAALCSYPVADLTHLPEGRLVRWQRVEQLRQHFWARWSAEYLHTLIQRTKWHDDKGGEVRVGQLVLIQQPGLAPLQ